MVTEKYLNKYRLHYVKMLHICNKCGHQWKSRNENPRSCPNQKCRSKKWNIESNLADLQLDTRINSAYMLMELIHLKYVLKEPNITIHRIKKDFDTSTTQIHRDLMNLKNNNICDYHYNINLKGLSSLFFNELCIKTYLFIDHITDKKTNFKNHFNYLKELKIQRYFKIYLIRQSKALMEDNANKLYKKDDFRIKVKALMLDFFNYVYDLRQRNKIIMVKKNNRKLTSSKSDFISLSHNIDIYFKQITYELANDYKL